MRLLKLKDDGEISVVEFFGPTLPPYAILSHTWGAGEDEVTYKDIIEKTAKTKAGYSKIRFCGNQAAKNGLHYFWVDTCCIDKSSSAEVSEAINSMFRWYYTSTRCYVYLSDVPTGDTAGEDEPQGWSQAFKRSRWFTRGWTLQELIAPTSVEFFSKEGRQLGDKQSLERMLSEITGINVRAIRGNPMHSFSINERMMWAAKRETKREEDAAYSLLGIFSIHMPLIYGEGRENALIRLQKEIKESQQSQPTFHGAGELPPPPPPPDATKVDQSGSETVAEPNAFDFDSDDYDGWLPLVWAAKRGHGVFIKMLLETGIGKINASDTKGRTPLSQAAGCGHKTAVKILLEVDKVDVDQKDFTGRTPLTWAARNGHEQVVEVLLKTGKVEVDTTDEGGRTPLVFAAIQGREAVVKLLLTVSKVNVDVQDVSGWTPLAWAADNGHALVVKLLLGTNNVDVNLNDFNGRTPLTWAALNGHASVIKLLLGTGKVDVNAKDTKKRTPLSWAAGGGFAAAVKLLLDTGQADVDTKDFSGRTPLSYAVVVKGNEAMVILLRLYS